MTIGIICAMPEEAAAFAALASGSAPDRHGLSRGQLAGNDIVVASSGLGKVRAAMSAAMLIERHGCRALVSAGTAGGLGRIAPMQVVIGAELVQHDYGRSLGPGELELFHPGVPPLPDYRHIPAEIRPAAALLRRLETLVDDMTGVEFGKFASGDTFVNDADTRAKLEALGADVVDMECSAVAQVAESYELPWLVAKGISDAASTTSHDDFLTGLDAASRRSAQVVAALIPALAE
jgi:adenosylhomocysteine nucleosidase